MALRQTTGFVESLLDLMDLDWTVPDFDTLCRRQKSLVVDIASRRIGEPLHLLIDSTGIKVEGDGEWHARKHDRYPRGASGAKSIWLSMNKRWKYTRLKSPPATLAMPRCCPNCLTRSLQIRRSALSLPMALMARASAMMPLPNMGPMPSSRHAGTPSSGCQTPLVPRHATTSCALPDHLGRALWRRWSNYHRRSRVETKMNSFNLLGQRLMLVTSTGRSLKSRSGSPASIVTQGLESPSQNPSLKSDGIGLTSAPKAFVQQRPVKVGSGGGVTFCSGARRARGLKCSCNANVTG